MKRTPSEQIHLREIINASHDDFRLNIHGIQTHNGKHIKALLGIYEMPFTRLPQ